jgi:cytochrome P450
VEAKEVINSERQVLDVLCSQQYSTRSPAIRQRRQRDPEHSLRVEQCPNAYDGEQHRHYRRMVAPILNRCADIVDVEALAARVVANVADRGRADLYRDIANPYCCSIVDQVMEEVTAAQTFSLSERDGVTSMMVAAGISTVTKAIVAIFVELEGKRQGFDPAAFVEEVLREHPPVDEIPKWNIATGELVRVSLAGANEHAKHHHSFGAGPHYCPASRLARKMLIALVVEWQSRVPRFEFDQGLELRWEV